jgi:hypothetical protein
MDTKATPPPVGPTLFTREQMKEMLLEVIDAVKAGGGTPNNDALLQLIEAQNEMARAQQRTVRVSNARGSGVSPYSHPEGDEEHPKQKLDRETWFCGTRQEEALLKPEEIDAFNSLQTSKVWHGDPKFGVEVTPKRRFIMLPHISIDERMNMPPNIPLMARELQSGEDAVDPIKLEAEIRALKSKMAALETRVSPAVADAAKPVEAEF